MRTGATATHTAHQPNASAATDGERADRKPNSPCHNWPQSPGYTPTQAGNAILATLAKIRGRLRGVRLETIVGN